MIRGITSADELRGVLDYDPNSGEFRWRISPRYGIHPGDLAGCLCRWQGYWLVRVNNRTYGAHRLAWLHVYGDWPKQEIDHINGSRVDNRIANLRDVSTRTNQENQRVARPRNRLGLLGVDRIRAGFRAQISVNGKKINLGTFPSAERAYAVYVEAKRRLHAGSTI